MNARKRNQPLESLTSFIVAFAATMKSTSKPWLVKLFLGVVLVYQGFQVSQWIRAADEQTRFRQMYYQICRWN